MRYIPRPKGATVLIEVLPYDGKSKGGIILDSEKQKKREESGRDMGRIVEFGPLAFVGLTGCNSPADWGFKVGDIVGLADRNPRRMPWGIEDQTEYKNYRIVRDEELNLGFDVEDDLP
jgi:hypothetical protein